MAVYQEERLKEVSKQFHIYGEILHAEVCKIGHINETYAATYDQGGHRIRYIHQRINQSVFKDPVSLMNNIVRVTTHIRTKLAASGAKDVTRRTLTVVPTREGRPFYRDGDGEYWRTYVFVENVQTFEFVKSPNQAFEAGKAFGEFQSLLVDLPGERLAETIPEFHNARKRFTALQRAIHEDSCNRVKDNEAAAAIKFALKHEPMVDVLLKAQARGELPKHITHNDTKFNNVMLDVGTGKAMCVVDLDTVMPGCVLYDFGDLVRTATCTAMEDEQDLSKVKMDMRLFEELCRGYLDAAGAFLTPAEKSYLVFSGQLITFTLGVRFLTDFLAGDTYFRVHRLGHNLDRCKAQFKLVESLTRHAEAMQKFVDTL